MTRLIIPPLFPPALKMDISASSGNCFFYMQFKELFTGLGSSVECPLQGMEGHGFDPGSQHTKVVKNGTSCSSLGTQTYTG